MLRTREGKAKRLTDTEYAILGSLVVGNTPGSFISEPTPVEGSKLRWQTMSLSKIVFAVDPVTGAGFTEIDRMLESLRSSGLVTTEGIQREGYFKITQKGAKAYEARSPALRA